MQNRIEVVESHKEQNTLHLTTAGFNAEIKTMQDTAQMITDSDNVAFIYIIDINDQFIYVSLPCAIWPALKQVLETKSEVLLHINGQSIQLSGLIDELTYLIENIEGNANYGEEMVSKVESVFLHVNGES